MKGKIFAIFAVFAMVILFASPALALVEGIPVNDGTKPTQGGACIITSDAAIEKYYALELQMTTDKQRYNVGEPVKITIKNTADDVVYGLYINGAPGADLIITNKLTGEQVVNTGQAIHVCYDFLLNPGESYTYTWGQCYITPGYTATTITWSPENGLEETVTHYGCTHTSEQAPEGVYRVHWNGAGWHAETKIVIGNPGNNPSGFSYVPENQGTANNPNL